MKKLLGILVMLSWCSVVVADIYDLDISIKKAEVETEIIKPNKEYRQSCETGVTVEQSYIDIKFNSYIDAVGKKQTLVQEVTFDLGEDGNFIMKSQQKIKSDGTLSKVKASSDYIPGTTEVSKKEIKQAKKLFKAIAKYFDERAINYGEKLTLGIKREDAKKKMLKIIKDFEDVYLAAGEDPKDVKEFIKILKKDSKFEMIKEYLGTTELNGEKFYAVRWDATLEYVGNITEMKEVLEGLSYNSVYFIHAPSGYRSAVQMTMEEPDPSTEMYDDMICTIYKNDQMLTEVSISELEDKAVAKKTETKVKTTDDNNEDWELIRDKYPSGKRFYTLKDVRNFYKNKTLNDLVFVEEYWGEKKEHWDNKYPNWIGANYRKYKSWAISADGSWAWTTSNISQEDSVRGAVTRCNSYVKSGSRCVVIKVGDNLITYKEQAEWSKKIYGVTTLAAKIIEQNSSSTKTTVAKEEVKQTDDNNGIAQQLIRLNELYKSGYLTKEEFEKAKNIIIN